MKSLVNEQHSERQYRQNPEATWEMLVSLGEKLPGPEIANVQLDDLLTLVEELITIYDAPFGAPNNFRQRAAKIVAKLAIQHSEVLELVIENAEMYAKEQHSPDAFPYSPNSFEVIAEVIPTYDRVISFLHHVAKHDWGVASSCATQALQAIENVASPRSTVLWK